LKWEHDLVWKLFIGCNGPEDTGFLGHLKLTRGTHSIALLILKQNLIRSRSRFVKN
jgi:hypothetical protein